MIHENSESKSSQFTNLIKVTPKFQKYWAMITMTHENINNNS